LKDYIPFEETRGTPFETTFSGSTVEAIDLLKRLLKYDPNKRDTAKKVFFAWPPLLHTIFVQVFSFN